MKRIAILLAWILLFCACQPAPEQDAVISKAENKAAPIAAEHTDGTPKTYRQTLTENGVTVVFDAAVTAPESETLPSYALRTAGFSEEQLSAVVHALYGDGVRLDLEAGVVRADVREFDKNFHGTVLTVRESSRERSGL